VTEKRFIYPRETESRSQKVFSESLSDDGVCHQCMFMMTAVVMMRVVSEVRKVGWWWQQVRGQWTRNFEHGCLYFVCWLVISVNPGTSVPYVLVVPVLHAASMTQICAVFGFW